MLTWSPARRTGRAILMAPLFALAVVWVLLDDLFRSFVIPAVGRLAQLRPLRRLEAWIGMLSPYGTLALFVLPLAIIEPFKIYGLYLIGTGHLILGILAFIAAKVIGIGLAERLYAIGRHKLLSIRWFAWGHARTVALRDTVHASLKETRWWPALMRAVTALKRFLRDAKVRLGGGMRATKAWAGSARTRGGGASGSIGRRFHATRRLVMWYLHWRGPEKPLETSPLEAAPSLPDQSRSPFQAGG